MVDDEDKIKRFQSRTDLLKDLSEGKARVEDVTNDLLSLGVTANELMVAFCDGSEKGKAILGFIFIFIMSRNHELRNRNVKTRRNARKSYQDLKRLKAYLKGIVSEVDESIFSKNALALDWFGRLKALAFGTKKRTET